jgi:glycosyltransferase involved in cell wall biosynthesis
MAEELGRLARSLQIEHAVHLTGAVEHSQVPEYLAALDVAAAPYLPSDDFYFSPIKVFEYLAAGLPVVASRLGQIVPMAAAGHVWPAEAGDPAALAVALEAVLDAPEEAARRAALGQTWVLEERTWSANARRSLDIAALQSTAGTREP